MSFRIGSIQDIAAADVELRDPRTDAGLGAFIVLAGPEHPARRALVLAAAARLREAFAKTGRFVVDEAGELEQLEQLAALTLGWRGLSAADGTPLAFSAEAARALYADPGNQWIVRQLRDALEDRGRFITSSVPS